MRVSKRIFVRAAIPALFLAAGAALYSAVQSAPGAEDIANGFDPLTTGQVIGRYPGGIVLADEYLPYESVQLVVRKE